MKKKDSSYSTYYTTKRFTTHVLLARIGKALCSFERKRGRVVEGNSLENCRTRKGIRGSNPLASAIFLKRVSEPKVWSARISVCFGFSCGEYGIIVFVIPYVGCFYYAEKCRQDRSHNSLWCGRRWISTWVFDEPLVFYSCSGGILYSGDRILWPLYHFRYQDVLNRKARKYIS